MHQFYREASTAPYGNINLQNINANWQMTSPRRQLHREGGTRGKSSQTCPRVVCRSSCCACSCSCCVLGVRWWTPTKQTTKTSIALHLLKTKQIVRQRRQWHSQRGGYQCREGEDWRWQSTPSKLLIKNKIMRELYA